MTHRLCERRRPWKGTDSAVECFTDISPFCFDVVLFYMLIHYPKCNLLKENQAYSRHCHLVNQLVKNPEFNQRLSLQATSCRTNSGLDLTKRWKTNQRGKAKKTAQFGGKAIVFCMWKKTEAIPSGHRCVQCLEIWNAAFWICNCCGMLRHLLLHFLCDLSLKDILLHAAQCCSITFISSAVYGLHTVSMCETESEDLIRLKE